MSCNLAIISLSSRERDIFLFLWVFIIIFPRVYKASLTLGLGAQAYLGHTYYT